MGNRTIIGSAVLAILLSVSALVPEKVFPLEPFVVGKGDLQGDFIGRRMEYLIDESRRLTIDDVRSSALSSRFIVSDRDYQNFGYQNSVRWVRFSILNAAAGDYEWFLENQYYLMHNIDLYIPDDHGGFTIKRAGDFSLPYSSKEIKHNTTIFKIMQKPGVKTYYMRFHSKGSLPVILRVWTREHLFEYMANGHALHLLTLGIVFIMLLYNLFLFASIRSKAYLYYVLHITAIFFQIAILFGYANRYFWPQATQHTEMIALATMLVNLFAIFFTREFLETRRLMPHVDRILLGLSMLVGGGIVTYFFSQQEVRMPLAIHLAAISIIIILPIGIYLLLKRNRSAYFYVSAYFFFVLGASCQTFKDLGYLPTTWLSQYGYHAGISLMLILFSLGLADQVNAMKNRLAELNQNLERMVDARTAELHATMEELTATLEEFEAMNESLIAKSSELELANDRLKELDRLKSDFFANISHEIRTPLTLILSPVESILDGSYARDVDQGFFESMRKNGIRLLKLINNLLDFSRIEAGKARLKIQRCDIVPFIKNYIETVSPSAESRGISIRGESHIESLELYLDLEKMDRIIMNLLSNALKFTQTGGWVNVSIEDAGDYCWIHVRDNGVGIPAHSIDTVFERFVQADSGVHRKFEGSGIGLSLVKEFVEMLGGSIGVQSRYIGDEKDDHGTCFSIALPKGRRHLEQNEQAVFVDDDADDPIDMEKARQQRFRGMREMFDLIDVGDEGSEPAGADPIASKGFDSVLVVDDNPDIRRLLTSLLASRYTVYTASDGAEGLMMIAKIHPSLVLTDVMMPVMDGHEFTRNIRLDPQLKDIPIIMLTARAESVNKVEGMEYGADDYVTKPFNPQELMARIATQIKSYKNHRLIAQRNYEIEKELELARQIQSNLLPSDRLREPCFDSWAVYMPMDKVGGDFYDFYNRKDAIHMFIADVAGHGIPGALLSLVTKISLREIMDRGLPSFSVLPILNNMLYLYSVRNIYTTACYCVIDKATRVMRYSRAGHNPGLVYRRSVDEFYELFSKGMPLGWKTDISIEEKSIEILVGDRIILYTDGIIECMNHKREMFGDDGFREFVRSHWDLKAEPFANELIQRLRSFSGESSFADDVTMLVVDVTR